MSRRRDCVRGNAGDLNCHRGSAGGGAGGGRTNIESLPSPNRLYPMRLRDGGRSAVDDDARRSEKKKSKGTLAGRANPSLPEIDVKDID